jgi:methylmalonyl-CoA mutase cobalamin-binding subunit
MTDRFPVGVDVVLTDVVECETVLAGEWAALDEHGHSPGVIVIETANADYGVTVNLLALVAVPPEVVTAMVPVIAPVGTNASTSVSLMTW